ncbi:MAG TPA: hypothetical protein VN023_01220 [Methylovorus sp.]|nr:hypothetical protein [Methylovorus sp.]
MNLQIFLKTPQALMTMSPAAVATFERMLAVGQCAFLSATVDEMLCGAAGVGRQQDWPLAPLAALADGLDTSADYVMFAQPVHLQLRRDSFTIASETLGLQQAESEAFLTLLNQHFAGQGLTFMASPHCHHRWYVRLQSTPAIQTTAADVAVGRDIRPLLPRGRDAAFWNAFLNEVQMLLFDHPLNQAREARGELAVSGVWVYGGGVLPARPEATMPALFAEDAVARGLAILHASLCHEVPQDVHSVLQSEAPLVCLVPVESAGAVVNDLPFLWQALRQGRLRHLELAIAMGDRVLQCKIDKWDTWKFWRKSRPWTEVLGG